MKNILKTTLICMLFIICTNISFALDNNTYFKLDAPKEYYKSESKTIFGQGYSFYKKSSNRLVRVCVKSHDNEYAPATISQRTKHNMLDQIRDSYKEKGYKCKVLSDESVVFNDDYRGCLIETKITKGDDTIVYENYYITFSNNYQFVLIFSAPQDPLEVQEFTTILSSFEINDKITHNSKGIFFDDMVYYFGNFIIYIAIIGSIVLIGVTIKKIMKRHQKIKDDPFRFDDFGDRKNTRKF